jgi:VIT1/CCC1 family predicted Fe2+/Mn2+ transporter
MPSRDLKAARTAYKVGDLKASKKAHEIRAQLMHEKHEAGGDIVKSLVYGGLDGVITTFAVVSGVVGASLDSSVILILGMANLLADGLSMSVGDYISTRAEQDYQKLEREREGWEVDNYPEGERHEMVEIYMEKGLTREDANEIMNRLSKYKEAWLDVMMLEELKIVEDNTNPIKNALVTFGSFTVFGFVPLSVFVLGSWVGFAPSFGVSLGLTLITLFGLGVAKSKFSGKAWWQSGLEMVVIGGLSAGVAYYIGQILSNVG